MSKEKPQSCEKQDELIEHRRARLSESDREKLTESLKEQLRGSLTKEQFDDLFNES
ncbi:uncharacterized protein METZ01_LOCUS320472 [marine metagenome]|uniref:Uncharacterized protein n=1 Tax=marine metagenome TaxID=408172 RepID=A0A382P4E9_9ZZZZ